MTDIDIFSINVNDITAYHFHRKKKKKLDMYIQWIITSCGSIEDAPKKEKEKIIKLSMFLDNYAAENNLEYVEKVLEARNEYLGKLGRSH